MESIIFNFEDFILEFYKESEEEPNQRSSNIIIQERSTKINSDGTISIYSTKFGRMVKLRFSLGRLGPVNIVEIKKEGKDYKITSRSGNNQNIKESIVNQIINFVDSDQRQTTIPSGNIMSPSITITKITKK